MNALSGKAKLAGVAGWPVTHSKSPRMHGHWLQQLGIDGAYVPLAIEPQNFDVAIRGLQATGFKGLNTTIPHKEAAYNIAEDLSNAAKAIGAVNTLVFTDDGRIFGDNTDGYGFIQNIKQAQPNFNFEDGTALVLGAGGAAKAIVHSLIEAGVSTVKLCNRTAARAEQVATMNPERIQVVAWEDRVAACADATLLVNTTALGMKGQADLDMPLDDLPTTALVTDIVYVPLQTELLKNAAARGNPTVDGIGMLLHQAVRGFDYWFGQTPVVDEELRNLMLAD